MWKIPILTFGVHWAIVSWWWTIYKRPTPPIIRPFTTPNSKSKSKTPIYGTALVSCMRDMGHWTMLKKHLLVCWRWTHILKRATKFISVSVLFISNKANLNLPWNALATFCNIHHHPWPKLYVAYIWYFYIFLQDIWFQIGHVYELKKDVAGAKRSYEKVLKFNPNHAKGMLFLLYCNTCSFATTWMALFPNQQWSRICH